MPFDYRGCGKEELGGNFDTFPEGKYEFFIESIIETYISSGAPVVEMVLKPSDVNMQRYGKVWHRIRLDNDWTRVNIGRFLAAIGRDPEEAGEIFFDRYRGEYLTAKIKHNRKDGVTYVNARLLPKTSDESERQEAPPSSMSEARYRVRGADRQPASSLANEWDGESGNDDIPF